MRSSDIGHRTSRCLSHAIAGPGSHIPESVSRERPYTISSHELNLHQFKSIMSNNICVQHHLTTIVVYNHLPLRMLLDFQSSRVWIRNKLVQPASFSNMCCSLPCSKVIAFLRSNQAYNNRLQAKYNGHHPPFILCSASPFKIALVKACLCHLHRLATPLHQQASCKHYHRARKWSEARCMLQSSHQGPVAGGGPPRCVRPRGAEQSERVTDQPLSTNPYSTNQDRNHYYSLNHSQ